MQRHHLQLSCSLSCNMLTAVNLLSCVPFRSFGFSQSYQICWMEPLRVQTSGGCLTICFVWSPTWDLLDNCFGLAACGFTVYLKSCHPHLLRFPATQAIFRENPSVWTALNTWRTVSSHSSCGLKNDSKGILMLLYWHCNYSTKKNFAGFLFSLVYRSFILVDILLYSLNTSWILP